MLRASMAALVALAIATTSGPARASDPDTAGMARLFASLEKGIREASEALFKAGWHPEGYTRNFVGGSGLAGFKVYNQGTRKHWFLRPDLKALKTVGRGAPFIVPCDIWSWEKNKAVDHVWAALIWHGKAWVILGAGEKLAEVEALAKRYQEKKPLAPPAK